MCRENCHHSGRNAFWISAEYVVFKPLPGALEIRPRTVSVGSTCCCDSGLRASNFLPTWRKSRPSADISTLLRIGPSDCEHSAEFTMPTCAGPSFSPATSETSRCVDLSRAPKGLLPLQTFCARPSQKLRKLNTAFTALGVLRPVTLRVLIRFVASTGSG